MAETIEREVTDKGQLRLAVSDKEYTISIIGLVTAICGQPVVGLVLSILALKQSRNAERHNIYALLGLIFAIVQLGIWLLVVGFYIVLIVFGIVTGHARSL